MRRDVRVIHLGEARSAPLQRRIVSQPVSRWPKHLGLGYAILRDELHLTESRARELILKSILAAQVCAQAVNRRSAAVVEAKLRTRLALTFGRLGNCCRRASAGLRRRLDAVIAPLLQQNAIDAEVIEAIIDVATAEFQRSSPERAAATALRAILVAEGDSTAINWVKNDFAGLQPQTQRRCELALSRLGKTGKSVKAHIVFDTLKGALECKQIAENPTSFLIAGYIEALVPIWKAAGLNPSRASHPANPAYKSKFHRFSDLVLTAVVEPWSRRHDNDRDHMRHLAHRTRMKLPNEYRQICAALSPSDTGWLVSEHILRKGLRRRI